MIDGEFIKGHSQISFLMLIEFEKYAWGALITLKKIEFN